MIFLPVFNFRTIFSSLSGDGEGGIEMTGSMQLIREFCDLFIKSEKVTRTRIVCPKFFKTHINLFLCN